MRKIGVFALLLSLGCAPALAADTPPSDQSIRQLLTITDAQKLLDSMFGQIELAMKSGMDHALQGRMPSPQEQEVMNRNLARTAAVFREEMSWQKLEPIYLRIYRESLTQDEVDGMIAFYETPAGRALIRKMPAILQASFREMRAMMGPMMGRMKQIEDDTRRELNAVRGTR